MSQGTRRSTKIMVVSSVVGLLGFAQLTLAATGSATTSSIAGVPLTNNGPGVSASWDAPIGIAVNSSNNLVVSDISQHVIRMVAADGSSTSLAGSPGLTGATDGTGTAARFNSPTRMVQDSLGNTFVADRINHMIRKVTSAGVTTVFAGTGAAGSADGTGAAASFVAPVGITIDSSDNLFISEVGAHRVRKITSAGVVTTIVTGGSAGSTDGAAASAKFSTPSDLAWSLIGASGASGALYVSDTVNRTIRLVDLDLLTVSTVMGSGTAAYTDATGTAAAFYYPLGVAISAGKLYVSDYAKVRVVDLSTTVVSTLAGGAVTGFANGTGAAASFNLVSDVAPDSTGTNLYVTDVYNSAIRKIVIASGVVTTMSGLPHTADGTGTLGRFYYPYDVATYITGNLYVADYGNNSIRNVTPAGDVTTFVGIDPATNGTLTDGPVATAGFKALSGIVTDALGSAFVTDSNSVRKITSAGTVSTIAGSGTAGLADGTGAAASFSSPSGIALLANGDLIVADTLNHRIRRVTQAGVVTTLAGSTSGVADGAILSATFDTPVDVAVAPDGSIYVAQNPGLIYGNHMVRKISSDGTSVSTIVGPAGGTALIAGSGANCTVCDASSPLQTVSLAYDAVHSVMLVGTPGKILGLSTGASPQLFSISGTSAATGYVEGNSATTRFGYVNGMTVTANGDIFVADVNNNVVRKLSSVQVDLAATTTTTVASTTTTTVATTTPSSSTTVATTVATTAPTTTKPAAAPITTPTATPAVATGAGRIVSLDGTSVAAIVANNTTTKIVSVCAPSSTPTTTTTVVSTTSTTVPASTTLPADVFCMALPLGTDVTVAADGVMTIMAGKSVTVRGVGFKPSSTVEIWIFSTPKLLGTATAGTDGVLNTTFTFPTNIGDGVHTLQVDGTNAAGVEKGIAYGLKVLGSTTTSTPTTVAGDTSLPFTGPKSALPLLLLSAMGGFAGLWLRRRAY